MRSHVHILRIWVQLEFFVDLNIRVCAVAMNASFASAVSILWSMSDGKSFTLLSLSSLLLVLLFVASPCSILLDWGKLLTSSGAS